MTSVKTFLFQTVAILSLTGFLLSGCAAGPDFKEPRAPASTHNYNREPLPKQTESAETSLGGAQRFAPNGDVPADWWHLYQSAPLTHLVNLAIKKNASLEAARAALRAASENTAAERGGYLPSITGSATDSRSKTSGSEKPYTVYNTSVSVSYAPDLFGGTRRAVESLEAAEEAQQFEVEAAYLSLTSNVVTTAITEASLREQLQATQEILQNQKKQREIMQAQYDAGALTRQELLAQTSAVATTEAALPSLEKSLSATRNAMAVLIGQAPSRGVPAAFMLDGLTLPDTLPVSLPSNLVKQRPDIRASLANLKTANAKIGVATAAMLPQLSLSGSFGVGAATLSDMFTPTTALWGLAAGLTQPLFKGGSLLHSKRAAEASFDQAAALYRGTVLAAFQDVANCLKALETDAQTLKFTLDAEKAAKESLDLATEQFNAGAINFVDLLSAQSSYQEAKIALIKAKAARLSDTAALYQSLGGGWWNRAENKAAAFAPNTVKKPLKKTKTTKNKPAPQKPLTDQKSSAL